MSEQTIQSQDISVAGVFQHFYVVPDYQREYVWETEQVEQLLGDIQGEMAGTEPGSAPEYFIGSIVVCPGRVDGVMDLIDGQQRMTTLFLSLCAIRDRIAQLGEKLPGALEPQIHAVAIDGAGNDISRYRLDLQYEDSGDVLTRVARGERASAVGKTTRSMANILRAYDTVLAFLRREFGDDAQRVRAFYAYLTTRVKLIRIQTEDVAKALKIFETINDRGVGLDAMDLLKNLLFMKATHAQFDELKKTWKSTQDVIYSIGEKPLRFLRYFIFSRYDVEILREDEIYSWFSRNEAKCGYARQPIAFANELLLAAQAYRNFLQGKDQKGEKNRYLENLQLLGGRAARQHLILLLAGRHLPPAQFDRLAREVEELFFVYVITREATRDFERDFARWAGELRQARDEATLLELVERRFVPAKAVLAARFDEAFARLYSFDVQQYRLRYILAKLTQHIELAAYGDSDETKWLGRFTASSYQIEHIHPRNPSAAAEAEFGAHTDPSIAERLGNLVLVEDQFNASLGNKAYSQKRPVYVQSKLLLTRAVAERPRIGVNTGVDIAVRPLEPFPEWNEAAVTARQQTLARLAREAWHVPTAESAALRAQG